MIRQGAVLLNKPTIGAQVDRSHPSVRGLQSCWLFNESSGNASYDAMGRYDFAFTGGVARTAAPNGPAVKFNGTTGQGIATGNPLAGATALTIIVYFRQTDVLGSPYGPYFGTNLASTGGVYVGSNTLGNTIFDIGTVENSVQVPVGVWSHAAFLYDSVKSLKTGYLNGILKLSVTNAFGVMPAFTQTYIGKRPAGDSGYTTDSTISYIKVWNRALTQSEIAADYASPWEMFTPANDKRFFAIAGSGPPPGTGITTGSLAIGGAGAMSIGIS